LIQEHGEVTKNAGQKMKARMRADLHDAMKGGRSEEAKVIRALIAAIDNAEAPPQAVRPATDQLRFVDGSAEIARLSLDHDEVRSILLVEQHEREHSGAEMARLDRPDRAETLRHEAMLIGRYLA
jgi:uncharacterized protein YqeY